MDSELVNNPYQSPKLETSFAGTETTKLRMGQVLLLPFAPWRTARLANECSLNPAFAVGTAAITLQLGVW